MGDLLRMTHLSISIFDGAPPGSRCGWHGALDAGPATAVNNASPIRRRGESRLRRRSRFPSARPGHLRADHRRAGSAYRCDSAAAVSTRGAGLPVGAALLRGGDCGHVMGRRRQRSFVCPRGVNARPIVPTWRLAHSMSGHAEGRRRLRLRRHAARALTLAGCVRGAFSYAVTNAYYRPRADRDSIAAACYCC